MIHPHRGAHRLGWAATCATPDCPNRFVPALPTRTASQMAADARTDGWRIATTREDGKAVYVALCPSCAVKRPTCTICDAVNHPAPGHRWYGQRAHYPPGKRTRVRSTRVLAWPHPDTDGLVVFATTAHTPSRAALNQLTHAATHWASEHGPGTITAGTAPGGHPHLHYTPTGGAS